MTSPAASGTEIATRASARRLVRSRRDARRWAVVASVAALAGLLLLIPGLPTPVAVALAVILIGVAPGGALRSHIGMPAALTGFIVPIVGLAALIAIATVMALTHSWSAPLLTVLLVGATLATAVPRIVLTRDVPRETGILATLRSSGTGWWGGLVADRRRVVLALVLTATIIAFVVIIPALSTASTHEWGLLFAVPAYAAIIAVVVVCCAVAIRYRDVLLTVASLAATIIVLRLPVTVAADAPVYSWTSKHLGVVDLITANGGVLYGADIYQLWPGMFAASAWFCESTGMSVQTLAHWFPVISQFAFTLGVYAVARAFGRTPGTAAVAALVAQVANWVGQDYFSPQAVAVLLGLGVIALLVSGGRKRSYAWIALGIFATAVATHQLTPYWVVAAVVALCILGYVRPAWIGILFVAVVGGYLAATYDTVAQFGPLVSGDALQNLQTASRGDGSTGQTLTALSGRAASVVLWMGAGLSFVAVLWKHRAQWRTALAMGAVAFSPFGLLLAQGYGGEALLRVMLYSIAGSAVLVSPWIRRLLVPGSRWLAWLKGRSVLAVIALVAVALAGAQAYYGAWFANRIDDVTYTAMDDLLRDAPKGAVILGIGPGGPGRTVGEYAERAVDNPGFDALMATWQGWAGTDLPSRATDLTDDLARIGVPTFLVFTEEMTIYSDFYGVYPAGAIEGFEERMLADSRWHVVIQNPEVTIVSVNDGPQ